MTYSCIICLNERTIKYFNVCGHCNNFIICTDCYKKKDTHKLNNCVMCRRKLIKENKQTNCTFFINYLFFLRYFLFYVFLVILPSNIIASYLPDNLHSQIIITNKEMFTSIVNINNFIVIPYILYYYEFSYYIMFILFSFINILFFILFVTKAEPIDTFFIIYNIIYIYTFVYFHLCAIMIKQIIESYVHKLQDFVYDNNMYLLKIYDTLFNRIMTFRF